MDKKKCSLKLSRTVSVGSWRPQGLEVQERPDADEKEMFGVNHSSEIVVGTQSFFTEKRLGAVMLGYESWLYHFHAE